MRELARAKINLSLEILSRRSDGYHNLQTAAVFPDIGDFVSIIPASETSLHISGAFANALSTEDNRLLSKLAAVSKVREGSIAKTQVYNKVHADLRAKLSYQMSKPHLCSLAKPATSKFASAVEFGEKSNILLKTLDIFNNAARQNLKYRIHLEKNLPVAAGIGGGSADAAALLRLLNKNLDAPLDSEIMLAMAGQIGADVAMCLYSQPVIATGVGDILMPVTRLPDLHLVLVNPILPLSTRDVFKAYTSLPRKLKPIAVESANLSDLISLLEKHPNDLEETAKALMPQVGEIITALRSTPECLLARMSGSGATCFGIFESTEKASHAAQILKAHFPGYWVIPCRT